MVDDVLIGYGDNQALDAFNRARNANPISLFDNKNIHSDNRNQWEEPIIGALIVYTNLAGGPFQVAEIITGGTSGTIGTVTAVDGGTLTITYTVNHDDFQVGEQITGGTSGATADISTVGTGSTITHSRDNAAVTLQVGTSSGDSATRASHRYFGYVPGKSHEIYQTFLFGEAAANVRRRVGYFDDDNGLFLEQTASGIRFIRRSKTSGSVQEEAIEQASWNRDTFDGSEGAKNPSGRQIDFNKIQFLYIDFQWQGTGRIRFGFFSNGKQVDAHHFELFNRFDTVYMSTPSLPIRYEITNTGATSSTHTMKEFCTAVNSNGGELQTGVGYSQSNDILGIAVSTAETPVILIRLKSSVTDGGANRKTIRLSNAGAFATGNSVHWILSHMHDPSGISTATTWVDVGGGSEAEYSVTTTAITGNPKSRIEEGYLAAGQGGKGGDEGVVEGDKLDQHKFLTQNVDSDNSEVFMLSAAALTGTSTVYGHITWVEFD